MATDNECFRLILKNEVYDSKKEKIESYKPFLTIGFNDLKAKLDDNYATIALIQLDLDKHVGRHNELEAEFQIDVKTTKAEANPWTFSKIESTFQGRNVQLQVKEKRGDDKYFDVADNFFVVEVKPSLISQTTTDTEKSYTYHLKLRMASWDIFLDMTKYSRAYTAKKLGVEIMEEMISLLNGNNTYKLSAERSGMRVLWVTPTKNGQNSTSIELKQPYLVQYNETDYNFLLRNANRCGEFLYFERGKLNLGLTKQLINVPGKPNEYKERDPIEVNEFSRLELVSNVDAPLAATASYCNAFTHSEKGSNPFVAEYSNEDYFEVFEQGKFDSKTSWKDIESPNWSRIVGQVFEYDSNLINSAIDIGLSEAKLELSVKALAEGQNKKFDEKYFKTVDSNNTSYALTKNGSKCHAEFADIYDGKSILTSNLDIKSEGHRPDSKLFWAKTEEERKRSQHQYRITFDSSQRDIQLGDIVKVDAIEVNTRYVVVDVKSSAGTKGGAWSNSMEITVIPEGNVPVPLPAEVEMVRRAGAQSATVTDSMDPKRMGRVRVRYHWQDNKHQGATPWIRVSVPFSSNDESGTFSKLNVGDEVMVNYENGNIERPYVVGSLYNSDNPLPFGDRKYTQLIRSRNGHMIGFREPTNTSGIFSSFFPGLNFFKIFPGVTSGLSAATAVNGDGPDSKGRKVLRSLGGIDICDTYGMYSISTSSDSRCISISSPFGTIKMDAAMGITLSAPNGNIKIEGKNVDIVAGNNLTLKSGENIDNAFFSSIGNGDSVVNSLLNEAKTFGKRLPGLFDLPALRFALELIIKPISGTLKIHSGRYLMLEAGEGGAAIPNKAKSLSMLSTVAGNRYSDINMLTHKVELFIAYMHAYKDAFMQEYVTIREMRNAVTSDYLCAHDRIFDPNRIGAMVDSLVNINGEVTFKAVYKTLYNEEKNQASPIPSKRDKAALYVMTTSKRLKRRVRNFYNANGKYKNWEPILDSELTDNNLSVLTTARKFVKGDPVIKFSGNESLFVDNLDTEFKNELVAYLRTFNISGGGNVFDLSSFNENIKWSEKVDGITYKNAYTDSHDAEDYFRKDWGLKIAYGLAPVDNIMDCYTWSKDSGGAILMSQAKGKTISIEGDTLKTTANALEGLKKVLSGAELK